MPNDPYLKLDEGGGSLSLTPEGEEAFEAVANAAEEIYSWFEDYYARAEEQLTDWYLVFEDFGLVDPYYDPLTLTSTTEEEWEVFV